LQVGGHGVFGNVAGPGLPRRTHGLLTDHGLLADRAPVIEASELPEAMRVYRVSAGQILRRLAGREHVLAAHRTIVLVLVTEALVRVKDGDGDAHATLVAVPEGLHPTNAAKPALRAMERLFGHGHPKVAGATMVLTKDRLAVGALISGSKTSARRCEGFQFGDEWRQASG